MMSNGKVLLLNLSIFIGTYCLVGLNRDAIFTPTKYFTSDYSITNVANRLQTVLYSNNSISDNNQSNAKLRVSSPASSSGIRDKRVAGTVDYDLPEQHITRQIIQTFKVPYDKMQPNMKNATDTWRLLNPEYEYRFFDDEMMEKYVYENGSPEYIKLYDNSMLGAAKSDLFRLLIIYLEGGVYSDIDTVLLKPLRDIIRPEDDAVSGRSPNSDREIHQFVLVYAPGHPFLGRTILNALKMDPRTETVVNIAGPAGLNKAAKPMVTRRSQYANESYEDSPLISNLKQFHEGYYWTHDIVCSGENRPYNIRVLPGDDLGNNMKNKKKLI